MNKIEILKYYSRSDILDKIMKITKDREVVPTYDENYGERPNIILFPKDVLELVKKGATSFHCSVEIWKNPMMLSNNLSKQDLDELRLGWSFVLDIDAKVKLEHAATAAKVVYEFLNDLGITPTIKFSGSRGFHIGIASNAFPEKIDFKETRARYPEIPQAIAGFIIEKTREHILEEMITIEGGVAALVNMVPSVSELTPSPFIDIDDGTYLRKKEPEYLDGFAGLEKGWSNRHLFRMPYSLHPKQWLVSIPIKAEDIRTFKPEDAKPEKIKADVEFLVNKEGEATELLLQALDWKSKQPKEIIKEVRIGIKSKKPILEEFFPPCIKLILNSLQDGKKRSLFSLIAFLRNVNWKQEDVEKRIREWNMKNSSPLTERFIKTQLKWHFRQNRNLMPANCNSELFYDSIGICKPDKICDFKKIKNPVNYSFRLMKRNKE